MVISPGAMTIRWTAHPKTNSIRATSGAPAAAWQPSATQVHLWKTPHGEATSGFVQLILTLSTFRRCPVRARSPILRRCPIFCRRPIFQNFQFSRNRKANLRPISWGFQTYSGPRKVAVQFLIQFLLSNLFGHGSSIFKGF